MTRSSFQGDVVDVDLADAHIRDDPRTGAANAVSDQGGCSSCAAAQLISNVSAISATRFEFAKPFQGTSDHAHVHGPGLEVASVVAGCEQVLAGADRDIS